VPLSGSRNGAHGEAFDGGYKIKSVKYDGKDVKYTITDTRMQIDLPNELKANGGVAKLKIEYSLFLQNTDLTEWAWKIPRTGRSSHWPNGIRECVCTMM
jgi:hypothetical protein